MSERVMASIEEVWGTKFASPTPLDKKGKTPPVQTDSGSKYDKPVYSSPTERTQAAIYKNRKTIDDLSRSLPIVRSDEEGERNFAPETTKVYDVARPMRESMTDGSGYAYAPPGFQSHENKLNQILRMIEQNKTGYETASTHDMILYVFTGVFFLFTLDTFVRIGKRMR